MLPRLSILHVIDSLDGYGCARTLRQLARHQAAAGALVTVAAMHADPVIAAELRRSGAEVQLVKRRWPLDLVVNLRLRRLRRSLSMPRIIHTWDAASLLHAACLKRQIHGERVFAHLDGAEVNHKWLRKALSTVCGRIDCVLVPNGTAKAHFRRLGFEAQRIQLVPSGVETIAPHAAEHSRWLSKWELPPDAKVIATAGPLARHKAVDEAIWCFELVRVLYPNVRLLILGDGPDRERLERFADEVSDPGCIRFLGYRTDVDEILPHADVYWQLDAAHSTPLALLEAQAAAVPVVVSDVPALRAAIAPDESGFVVPRGNRAAVTRATDDLFRDADLCQRMGAAGSALIACRHSVQASLAEYDRLYALELAAGNT